LHRFDATKVVLKVIGSKPIPIVANLGPTTDELWHAGDRPRNFYTWGSMGLCSSMALGMALSTEEQVVSLDGDGSLLMNLGAFATIAREKPKNLIVIVWDNEEWGQTGHQPSHTAFGTDLAKVAAGCGIPHTATVSSEEQLETTFRQALRTPGPWVIIAKIEETEHLPYAPIEPEIVLHRFRATFPRAKTNPLTEPWIRPNEVKPKNSAKPKAKSKK
jgi:sulfopyruvate decarboxylase subunit beta